MKNLLPYYIFFLLFSGLVALINSCNSRKTGLSGSLNVMDITQTSAVVKSDNTASRVKVLETGMCWSTSENPGLQNYMPSDKTDTGNFICIMRGLTPDTKYFIRAYVRTRKDTIYGDNITFKTKDFGTLTDNDGNIYKTVSVGTQTWMKENLRSTRLNDGSAIKEADDEAVWTSLTSPGYCWFKNDEENFKDPYGALYNWYATNTSKLCPAGWHIPNEADWDTLTIYLGGEEIAGGNLKETGTDYWVKPNTGATNIVCFAALPGGFRHSNGKFFDFGFSGYWWSSKQYMETRAYFRYISYDESTLFRFNNLKKYGFSVRCLKD